MRFRELVIGAALVMGASAPLRAQVAVGDRVRVTTLSVDTAGQITHRAVATGTVLEVTPDGLVLAPRPAALAPRRREYPWSTVNRLELAHDTTLEAGEYLEWLSFFAVFGGIAGGYDLGVQLGQSIDHDCRVAICMGRYALPTGLVLAGGIVGTTFGMQIFAFAFRDDWRDIVTAHTPAADERSRYRRDPLRTHDGESRMMWGLSLVAARPASYADALRRDAVGGDFHSLVRLGSSGALALRFDVGEVDDPSSIEGPAFGSGSGALPEHHARTSASTDWVEIGPQLMIPIGLLRPYVRGSLGFSDLGTDWSVGTAADPSAIVKDTTFDSFAALLTGGAGLLIPLTRGSNNVPFLDVGASVHHAGPTQHLSPDRIEALPDGTIRLHPHSAATTRLVYHIGFSIGLRS
jgi:hypothetical protein